jgi:hypothetical protein
MLTIHHGAGRLGPVPATSAGLKQIVATNIHPGEVTIHITYDDLDEEAQINFIAMCQKSLRHLRFILGLPAGTPAARSRVWRKYWRNKVDAEHGEGLPYIEFVNRFLAAASVEMLRCTPDSFMVSGNFQSSTAIAATSGRLVNMMKWCQAWTSAIKMVSEAGLSWDTFNKITLKCEQPIVRRRR